MLQKISADLLLKLQLLGPKAHKNGDLLSLYHVIKSSRPKIQLLNCKNLYSTRFSKRNGKLVRKKNLSGSNVQVIKIVFVDNKNLNKIIHLSANSLQKSRYSNQAEATFSTLAKVDMCEKEMPSKSRI